MSLSSPGIAILFEHSEWFQPLFAELDRRGIPYDRLLAAGLSYDLHARTSQYALVVNRRSPSAYLRGHGNGIFFVGEYLRHLKEIGVEVINGYDAYLVETSKAAQLGIYEALGIRYPRARVINHPSQAVNASQGMDYPVMGNQTLAAVAPKSNSSTSAES